MNGRFDKRALVGCIVMGGLALAAVVLHIESIDIWPFHHDDVAIADTLQNAPSVSEAPPTAAHNDTSDADIAYVLQAIGDNLQRNDLTAAKVLLDEVLAVHPDLPQALAFQQELRVREARANVAAAKGNIQSAVAQESNAVQESASRPSASKETDGPPRVRERTVRSRHVNTRGAVSVAQRHHEGRVANGHPKTRAEVVAELRRARADGTMPNFGGRHP